jgi:RNA polymerase-binding transcription factor DksA
MDRIQLDRGREAGSIEEQCARCEEAIVEEVCTVLSAMQDELSQDMTTAFALLKAGTYGYCVECHEAISAARLEALPFSTRCAGCETRRDPSRRQLVGTN